MAENLSILFNLASEGSESPKQKKKGLILTYGN